MNAAAWLWRRCTARTPPPIVETDTVYPLHRQDDQAFYRQMNLVWLLRFEDVLDVDKLRLALAKLLERDGWRKIGGRLRINSKGKMEVHVPEKFTDERPAFRWTHQIFDMPLDEHPVGARLPKAGDHPYVQLVDNEFQEIETTSDQALTPEALSHLDEPQCSFLVTSFTDQTIMALTWPHTLTSVMGLSYFMQAWSLMLAGREDEIPPFDGAEEDVMDNLGDENQEKTEPFALQDRLLQGFSLARFMLRAVWDIARRPLVQSKLVFLPASFVSHLLQQARDDLKASSEGEELPFVSEGDVLTAWTMSVLPAIYGNRPYMVMNVADLRGRVPGLFKPGHAYVQNTLTQTLTIFSAEDVKSLGLGRRALRVRQSIVEQTTPAQCAAYARLTRKISIPLFGEASGTLGSMTNWGKAKFFDIIDFAPAVVKAGVSGDRRRAEPGKIAYQHAHVLKRAVEVRNCFFLTGKDRQGSYWLDGVLHPDFWAALEKELQKFTPP
ncbi:hypothetical protein BN1723_002461 [Verticillium longisporum]|nr:Acetyltransferase pyiB like protein [Verticillium longisporum]CRK18324.1 hypothetical protein BN1723_002461 [Verticillium longisporum]